VEETSPVARLRRRMADGELTSSVLVTMPSVGGAQIWANAGVDLIAFDLEHGHIDLTTLHALIAATAGTDTVPVVRVPANVPWLVKQVLDVGAMGVVFPMVRDAADAAAAVAACRYPPDGVRGWGPFFAAQRRGLSPVEYLTTANDETFVAILVELPEAVDNIEAIAAAPGIDLIFAAAYDLSVNLGHPGNPGHPDVAAAFRRVEAAALAARVPLGGFGPDAEAVAVLAKRGYRHVTVGFDWSVYQRAVTAALAPVVDRRAAETDPRSGAAQI
jgi:4-hydroxy-2-oxoheptanedioate aldolase